MLVEATTNQEPRTKQGSEDCRYTGIIKTVAGLLAGQEYVGTKEAGMYNMRFGTEATFDG